MNETSADILFINEANLLKYDELSLLNIEGYRLELDKMYTSHGNARSIMYISKKLFIQRMKNDEKDNDSSIVVKVGLPNKPKFIIYGIYHQWTIPGDKESKEIKKQ